MSDEALRRLAWQCRRGMLELDELLLDFLERGYPELAPALQRRFQCLLEEDDSRLFQWLFEEPGQAPAEYQALIRRMRGE